MIAIITGDIIKSRAVETVHWLKELKQVLNRFGSEPKQWEIFRGDSFQFEIQPGMALKAALLLKATIKRFKKLDIRIAIGIGEKSYQADKITESNGTAFINSGECFEQLKKNTLGIKTSDKSFDHQMNLMFELASLTMDNWTPTSAGIIKAAIENPEADQKKLAEKLNIKQSNISRGLKRGGYDEINKMLEYYQKSIGSIC